MTLRFVKSTLAEQAYEMLRERIVSGELPSGHRLLPDELGQTLSISPTPIKEALGLLARDGLVEVESRRGALVRRFSTRDIAELYDARVMIETYAIRTGFAANRVDDAFVRNLTDHGTLYITSARRHTREGLRKALLQDHIIHTCIVDLARNKLVADWHQKILRQSQTACLWTVDNHRCESAAEEHDAVIQALTARDENRAVMVLIRHLTCSRDDLTARSA